MGSQSRECRGNGCYSGSNTDRHSEDIIDKKRRSCNKTRRSAEVVFCDDIRAAAGRICMNSLVIRSSHNRNKDDNYDSNRNQVIQERCAAENKGDQNFFSSVSSGLNLFLLPFQMPTRLAVGLGLESTLFPETSREMRPKIWVPRIHSLNGSRLLFDFYFSTEKINCQLEKGSVRNIMPISIKDMKPSTRICGGDSLLFIRGRF